MTYLVLARKWRPRSFETLVGQEHVVRALSHALTTQRLHHAWLFTGTRGVGKTTLSRILAKALNCETGITPTPCGQCQACREIDAGRFVDYLELDAASNRGVDEMTQLLEQAVYAPSAGRFKVYMIDEVHMLSGHAFNAMLKTLEEPPPHVKFILATTDPQKIPVTVLSRCLQFNLKQMAPDAICGHLGQVLGEEGIPSELGGLRLIGQAARGSMRDALSLTDQAIAYSAGNLTEDAVRAMLGTIDQRHLVRLLDALAVGDGAGVLAVANELSVRSLSWTGALGDLAVLLSQIAMAQRIPGLPSDDEPLADDIRRLAAILGPDAVQLFYTIAVHGRPELALAPDEYAGFVMTCLRMLAFTADGAAAMPAGEAPAVAAALAAPPMARVAAVPAVAVAAASVGVPAVATAVPTAVAGAVPVAAMGEQGVETAAAVAPAAVDVSPVFEKDVPGEVVSAAVGEHIAAPAPAPAPALAPAPAPASAPAAAPVAATTPESAALVSEPAQVAVSPVAAAVAASEDAAPAAIPAAVKAPVHASAASPSDDLASAARAVPDVVPASAPAAATATASRDTAASRPDGARSVTAARSAPRDDGPPDDSDIPDFDPPGWAGDSDNGYDESAEPAGAAAPSGARRGPASSAARPGVASAGSASSGAARSRTPASAPSAAPSRKPLPWEDAAPASLAARQPAAATTPVPASPVASAPRHAPAPWDDAPPAEPVVHAPARTAAPDAAIASPAATASQAATAASASAAPATASDTSRAALPAAVVQTGDAAGAVQLDQPWHALAVALPLTGLAAELARQAEWVGMEGDTVILRVATRLARGQTEQRVARALSDHFGRPLQLRIEVGATGNATAHAVAQADRAERQRAAEQTIEADPFVQTLLSEFGGRIVPGSIAPLDASPPATGSR